MSANRVIGVDVGGTKVLAGVVDAEGTVLQTVEHPTSLESQDSLLDQIVEIVRSLPHDGVVAVGCGVPSRVDQRTGVVIEAVNLPITRLPLRSSLADRLGLPVGVENDANAAALAEWKLGAGADVDDLVLLTLGTGVGGGVVVDGRLYRGWAELGHMVIVEDGEPCHGSCTGRGHVEAYCTGVAAGRLAERVLGAGARAHDLVEQQHPALDEVGHHLGVAIGSLVNVFGPEMVVIGGGFGVAAFDLLLPAARRALLREALPPGGERLVVERAQLGAEAGLVGAALVAFEAA
jgi:glucokinase